MPGTCAAAAGLWLLAGCGDRSRVVARENGAPSAPAVVITPGTPGTSDELRAVLSLPSADPEGMDVRYQWRWLKDGVLLPELTSDTVPAALTRKGESWTVVVVPVDDLELAGPPASHTVTVRNTPPTVALAAGPGPWSSATGLRAEATTGDADGEAVRLEWVWRRGAEVMPWVAAEVPPGVVRRGESWTVEVTPRDDEAAGLPAVRGFVVENTPPAGSSVTLSPAAGGRNTPFRCEPQGFSDADGDPEGWRLTWLVEGAQAGSAATLPAGTASRGQVLTCEARPYDGFVEGAPLRSAPVAVGNSPPEVSSVTVGPLAPTRGTAVVATVTGLSDADGDAPTLAFAWHVNGVPLASAPGATLPAGTVQRGDAVGVVVTPADGFAQGTPVASNTVVVVNSRPEVAGVSVSAVGGGTPRRGVGLEATAAGVADADGDAVTLRYAWSVAGRGAVATGALLPGDAFSKGESVWVTAWPDDGLQPGVPVDSVPVVIGDSPPSAPAAGLSGSRDDEPLVCSLANPSVDPDGEPVAYSFEWALDGVPVPAAGSPGGTVAGPTSTLAPSLTAVGQRWSCRAVAQSGGVSVQSPWAEVTVQAAGPCSWTPVVEHALDVLPPGAEPNNGLLNGQAPGQVGGRTAWLQRSDWNHFHIPMQWDPADDVGAVSVDVWLPRTDTGFALGIFNERAQYNDILQGAVYGLDVARNELSGNLHAPVNNDWKCCSTPFPEIFRVPNAVSYVGSWHRLRTEFSRSRGVLRFLVDGALVANWQGTVHWNGTKATLHGGTSAWGAAEVGYSDFRVERGTPDCIP
jgi:hypothetical protein